MKVTKNVLSGWREWADCNLPDFPFAGLTGGDLKVVEASIVIAEAAGKLGVSNVLDSWVAIVSQAQPFAAELCCHLVARHLDWGHREEFAWALVAATGEDLIWDHRCVHENTTGEQGIRRAFRAAAAREVMGKKNADKNLGLRVGPLKGGAK